MKQKQFESSSWKRKVQVLKHSHGYTPNYCTAFAQAKNWHTCAVGEAITRQCPDFADIYNSVGVINSLEEHFKIRSIGCEFPRAVLSRNIEYMEEILEAADMQIRFYKNRVNEVIQVAQWMES